MHRANLVAITEVKSVPPDILPFVHFRADVEGRELEPDEKVAILVIDTTTSYIPVFLKTPGSMAELESSLKAQDAELTSEARAALARYLK
ncbi:DUF749 domain-containing protein [Candidatus Bathyarchaeota archaeon]|nr:DUF749 domain-containing protein [Candidatus Bathyarchaeota archaeon]